MWPSEEKIGKAWAETQKPEHYLLLETATFSYPTSFHQWKIVSYYSRESRGHSSRWDTCTILYQGKSWWNDPVEIQYIYLYIYIYFLFIVTSLPKKIHRSLRHFRRDSWECFVGAVVPWVSSRAAEVSETHCLRSQSHHQRGGKILTAWSALILLFGGFWTKKLMESRPIQAWKIRGLP